MNNARLNLARAWRSRTFDEIIGQEMTMRIIKNSLFRGQLFPVYLLSGQRGCGKTTTGRVFAAAINCSQRSEFQKKPQEIALPCGICQSCKAMAQGNHPDFIEIDAASHTGVDNIRQIIESSAFLPVLGSYKIYLIDEAHMLSKAAFNAFLKVLEEPSASVLFLLATTEAHKIIDTVRSRCFQLFFEPVDATVLVTHLTVICKQENIMYDDAGLYCVAHETEGSVRDALNLIERVRLAEGKITQESVVRVLGMVSNQCLFKLLHIIAQGSIEELIAYIQTIKLFEYAPTQVWKRMISLLSVLLWAQHGHIKKSMLYCADDIKNLSSLFSSHVLTHYLELWYEAELLFMKTTAQVGILELLFIKMIQAKTISGINVGTLENKFVGKQQISVSQDEVQHKAQKINTVVEAHDSGDPRWNMFVREVAHLEDPLVNSIFKQGVFVSCIDNKIQVRFPQTLSFFKDLLNSTMSTWQPLLEKSFKQIVTLEPNFDGQSVHKIQVDVQQVRASNPVVNQPKLTVVKEVEHKSVPAKQWSQTGSKTYSTSSMIKKPREDVFDYQKHSGEWPITKTLLRLFPGNITEIKELL